jgi:hypothetical protein
MASIKRLKKEVGYLSSQLIGDCFEIVQTFNGKELEAMAVIDEIVALHNKTIEKVNNPDGKDNPKLVKSFYLQLKKDYITGINEAYKNLEKLVQ